METTDSIPELISALEKQIADDPDNVQLNLTLGNLYVVQLGKFDAALDIYQRILPKARDKASDVACSMGFVYFKKGDMKMAEQLFTESIAGNNVSPNTYLMRAGVWMELKEPQKAVADYEKYLELEPNSQVRADVEEAIASIRADL